MKIQVRLYGTLGSHLPDHDRLEGMVADIPMDSNVGDLMDYLAIPREKVGIISVDGILVKESTILSSDNFVRMYQPITGG
jgi:sulfur carrier protein ThiS